MKWSLRVARIAGIDVRVHLTFLALLAWLAWSQYAATGSTRAALGGLASLLMVFASVLAHEFGHALVARRYGIATRDITLLPIGGVAALERMPEDPRVELAVSVAGPAVNVVLAAVAWFLARGLGSPDVPAHPLLPGSSLLEHLAFVNVGLATFNMIPAFPMDGGRVLRALLSLRLGHHRATRIASMLGQGVAITAGVIGLFASPVLVFVALFVWLGAAEEGRAVMLEDAMAGLPVQLAMARDVRHVGPDEPLEAAVGQILDGHQEDLPVVDGGRVVGVLTRNGLIESIARGGLGSPVAEAMETDFAMAHPSEMLRVAHERLQAHACDSMPVTTDDGRIVGMLTRDSVAELLLIRGALAQRSRSAASPRDG